MTYSTTHLALIGALLLAAAPTALGQASFPEIEPNSQKSEATIASCMVAGDTLDGTTTGVVTTLGDVSLTTVDMYRVRTCPLALGIYAHELVITTAGTVGHTGTIRGLNQTGTVGVGGTAGTLDTAVQTSSTATTPPRKNRWYAFGKGEEIYYRVAGTATTTMPYVSTLTTTPVAATPIGPYAAGSITITSVGQGHSTDTEIALYDGNLDAITGALNDDVFNNTILQSTLTRTLSPGKYYLVVTRFNFADNRTAAADDDFVTGALLDFPNAAASSSTATVSNVAFAVTDTAGTTPVAASLATQYQMIWFKFDVLPAGGTIQAFCVPTVGGVNPCVCGNANGPGLGCANTGGPGASLAAAGVPSLSADSIVLTGSAMFSGSTCIFLQGNANNGAGATFGAGIRCTDGTLKRLYVKPIVAGSAFAPDASVPDPSVSVRSASLGDIITNGTTRWYQTYYRDPLLPNPGGACPAIATFNVTSGQQIFWVQ